METSTIYRVSITSMLHPDVILYVRNVEALRYALRNHPDFDSSLKMMELVCKFFVGSDMYNDYYDSWSTNEDSGTLEVNEIELWG